MGKCVNQGWWKCCEVGGSFDLLVDCMMVVKAVENGLLEEVKKLEWWFEQDIDDEGEEDEEDGGGDENGPLIWPTITEVDGTTRLKKYEELSATENIQANCDCKATNIILQGLLSSVYAIVNLHKVAKEICDRVKLLMSSNKLSKWYQSHEALDLGSYKVIVVNFMKKKWSNFLFWLIEEFGGSKMICSSQSTSTAIFNHDWKIKSWCSLKDLLIPVIGKGHIARQCTQPKRPRNAAWFKEKEMLVKALEAGQILDEEQLAFLVDPRIPDDQAVQTTIPNTASFQSEDVDAYDSNCDDVSNAKAVLMANLSSYGFDVFSEAPHSDSHHNDMDNQKHFINHVNNWEKANQEKNNESVTAQLERYKERVKTFEQRLNVDLSTREKMIDSQMDDMIKEKLVHKHQIDLLEQNLSNQIKEIFIANIYYFQKRIQGKGKKYIDKEINLEKKIKELDNILYKVIQIVLWYLDFGCSKHMSGNRSQLMNFVSKFLGTIRFGNNHVAKIMGLLRSVFYQKHQRLKAGYGTVGYRISTLEKSRNPLINPRLETLIKRNYLLHIVLCGPIFLRSKNESPDDIIKCVKNIQVRLNATVGNVKIDNGTEFFNQTIHDFYENFSISHQNFVARTPQQNGVVERDDWGRLFQPMFDEYFNPPTIVVSPVPVATPRAVDTTESPVST
nr:retrovirus-related Pol polyprotein from transposon TNT 1-94 [Tanacetum cinerariifolium]